MLNYICHWVWLIVALLSCNTGLARDPFHPEQSTCQMQTVPPETWQLLGVIGSSASMTSRWLTEQQRGITLHQHDSPGAEGWRIEYITRYGISLILTNPCSQTVRHFFSVKKGVFHAEVGVNSGSDPLFHARRTTAAVVKLQ